MGLIALIPSNFIPVFSLGSDILSLSSFIFVLSIYFSTDLKFEISDSSFSIAGCSGAKTKYVTPKIVSSLVVNTLIDFYKKNENLVKPFNNIVVEGTEHFSIIKNIPKVEIEGEKLISLITEDLLKLLYK